MFVTGFSSSVIDTDRCNPITPKPTAQAATRPTAAINTQPTPTTQRKPAMTTQRPTDAQLLSELAAKTIGDAAFAVNTHNLPDAANRLRSALSLIDRAIAATPGIQGNAGHLTDEFAGYNINDPLGLKNTPDTNPHKGAGFAGYSINAVNKSQPVDEFAGYDINAL